MIGDLPEFLALNAQFETLRCWLMPAIYARLQAGLGEFLTELRPAVALFLRFQGIDYALDGAAAQLDAYVRWTQGVLSRYAGTLLQITIGDKGSYLYATFGAPTAHEDDARRTAMAAIELLSPPQATGIVATQIGISQGVMRVGTYGGPTRRTYGVQGREANLAARLMQQAAPGEILVSGRVRAASTAIPGVSQVDIFDVEPLVPVYLKGLPDPVPVFRLASERGQAVQLTEPLYRLPIVGRAAELGLAGDRLAQALQGHGQIIGITAEAGIGKSRLVAEVIRLARRNGLRVFGGACQSYGTTTTYLVWGPIWQGFFELNLAWSHHRQERWLAGQIQNLAPTRLEAIPLLGPLLGLSLPENDFTRTLEPQFRQSALHELLLECVRAAAREAHEEGTGLLFVLEDLHWIDAASHDLLEQLAQEIADLPVLIVLAYRPPELLRLPSARVEALLHFTRVALAPLSDNESQQVIHAKLAQLLPDRQGAVPRTLIDRVIAQAQGNPFYLAELLHYLRDRGIDPWDGAAVAALELPASLHTLVLSRIDQRSERQRATLKVASVVGRQFLFAWLHGAYPALGSAEQLRADLNELADLDLTPLDTPEPELSYLFKHIVTHDVAYDSLTTQAQARLHEQLARYLERLDADRFVDLLAFHYGRSGLRDKTLHYLERAAQKAQRGYANEVALSYYRAALALEERWQWRQAEAEALHILGRREEEQTALLALEQLLDAAIFTVAYLWGQYHEALGSYPDAQAAGERALAAAQLSGTLVDQARSLALLGLIARRQGDYERAKDWYMAALALFPQEAFAGDAEAQALAQSLNGLGIVQRQQGNFAEARASYERAGQVCTLSNDLRGQADSLNGLGVTAYYQRDLVAALAYHHQALGIRQMIGDRAGQGISLLNLAQVNCDSGTYGQAEQYYLAALAIQQAVGNRWEEVNIWNGLGVLHQELGNLSEAKSYLQRGLALSREIGDSAGEAYLLSNLGLAVRDEGDLALAEALLNQGLALAQQQDDSFQVSFFMSYLASVSLRAGSFTQAGERAQQALAMRQALGLTLRTTADLTTLAAASLAIGAIDQALDYANQALAILDACRGEGPEFPQEDYAICARVLSAAGQHEAAQQASQMAYRLVMARATKITDPVLRQSFLEHVPGNRAIVAAHGSVGS
jgi:predicted ATPase/class 3 adenylate cyclase